MLGPPSTERIGQVVGSLVALNWVISAVLAKINSCFPPFPSPRAGWPLLPAWPVRTCLLRLTLSVLAHSNVPAVTARIHKGDYLIDAAVVASTEHIPFNIYINAAVRTTDEILRLLWVRRT